MGTQRGPGRQEDWSDSAQAALGSSRLPGALRHLNLARILLCCFNQNLMSIHPVI